MAQAKLRSASASLEIVLRIPGDAPLAVPTIPIVDPSLFSATGQNKVRRAVAASTRCHVRVAGEDAVVVEFSKSEVQNVRIVLLKPGRLYAEGEEVPSVLPCEVVVIVGIVA